MRPKLLLHLIFLLALAGLTFAHRPAAQTASAMAPAAEVTAYDLIIAMNTLRASYGLNPLIEDPIINAVAQGTAEIMAANQMSWHIGDVRGRVAAAGYGGGATVWATENFAVGNQTIDEIMLVWSDASHMIPAVNPAYCHVGAGVAKSGNGRYYYVLQAAYTSDKACGEYKPVTEGLNAPGGSTDQGRVPGVVPGIIVPVAIATPDADGKIFHEVKPGQSFWAIAIAYKITIKDIETWNNISQTSKLQPGQKLFIPGSNTEGYSTPTPVGLFAPSTPGPDGKIVHTVASYQTLSTISEGYKVSVDTLLALNGLQVDWPLQIDQKLVIYPGDVTPSPTPRPLTPLEKLTPAADGNYYHTVQSGETLSWIAGLYNVQIAELMAWNGITDAALVYANDKLLLQVTPPATVTPTPGPPTATPTATRQPPSPTATRTPLPVRASATPTTAPQPFTGDQGATLVGIGSVVLAALGIGWVMLLARRKQNSP